MYPINVVEKETNISKYLLRMWERRYTFPRPLRDKKGERVYTENDVEKLKLIKALMEEGYRPSKIIDQELIELRELSKSFGHILDKGDRQFVILVTSEALSEDVKKALKNQNVKKVIVISSQEDLKNLTI